MLNSFGIAQSGLRAAQAQLESIMNNIANADNVDYAKRVASLSELKPTGEVGSGVELVGIHRAIDLALKDSLQNSTHQNGYATQKSGVLSSVEDVFNELDKKGLSNAIDEFYTALEDYRANPIANESVFVAKATTLSAKFNSMSNDLGDIRDNLFIKADTMMKKVNSIIDQITGINAQIVVSESSDVATGYLLDQRDKLEKELSGYLNIDIHNQDPSDASIYSLSTNGKVLVRGETSSGVFDGVVASWRQQDKFVTDATGANSLENKEALTYVFNNSVEVNIKIGDTYDGQVVDSANIISLFAQKINNNQEIHQHVTAYDGEYVLDTYGNKRDFTSFLIIQSNDTESFRGFIKATDFGGNDEIIEKSKQVSKVGGHSARIAFNGGEIDLSNSALGVLNDNLDINSPNNLLRQYADALDDVAYKMIDLTNGYSFDNGVYKYGTQESFSDSNYKYIGIFDGSSASSMSFRKDVLKSIKSEDLEYLSKTRTHSVDGFSIEEGLNATKKQLATQTQEAITQKENTASVLEVLKSDYAKITGVNKDEEMVNLIKAQAAYQANAKTIQAADDMLQVLLSIKR